MVCARIGGIVSSCGTDCRSLRATGRSESVMKSVCAAISLTLG